jgi:hypothetical protein
MAVTEFQRNILKLIARNRIAGGESYVAGGVALNQLIEGSRFSRDIDLFHDTSEAVYSNWELDRYLIVKNGYTVDPIRELSSFIEVLVKKEKNTVLIQWARDSAYRFFPLVEDNILGLSLHPFDLATNKVLAMAGRLEVRDWIDVINCHDNIQNVGYLFWAACGKDPGFNPVSLISEAKRSSHYSAQEIEQLAFPGSAPDASLLGRQWHKILKESERIIELLPSEEVGNCILADNGKLFTGNPETLDDALKSCKVLFHKGSIKGAWPKIM